MPIEIPSLKADIRNSILLIHLDSPDGLPRLTRAVLNDLQAQMLALNAERDLRGAVITGTAKCFAAGAELREVAGLDVTVGVRFAALGQTVMSAIERSAKPVIAAISGYCMGGGFDLALACRMRVATPDATFAHRGATLGIMTGWGGTQRLPRMLGPGARSVAMELMATGRTIGAEEALELRIISRVVAAGELMGVAAELAGKVD